MSLSKPAVVIDNGSFNVKAGFSCDNHPVSIFRTVVGRPNYLNGSYGKEDYDVFIGDEAVAKSEDLEYSRPVQNGRIVHWDNIERIWHHCFYKELKVAPEDRTVMMTCTTETPMEEKIKCCEVFFETLNTPGLCIQPQGSLAMYGSGCTTGVSVDLGYDSADINPVYEGGLLRYAHMKTNVPGKQLNKYIKQKLSKRNLDFGPQTNDIIEQIKQHLYVSEHFVCTKDYFKELTLPSGEKIDISDEACTTAELLFQPNLVSDCEVDYISLQETIATAILKCDSELQEELYDHIVPWGGMATIPGLNERIKIEIEKISGGPVNVISSLEPYTVAWLGGATLASLTGSHTMWVTKKQFEDYGEKIVRNKFL